MRANGPNAATTVKASTKRSALAMAPPGNADAAGTLGGHVGAVHQRHEHDSDEEAASDAEQEDGLHQEAFWPRWK